MCIRKLKDLFNTQEQTISKHGYDEKIADQPNSPTQWLALGFEHSVKERITWTVTKSPGVGDQRTSGSTGVLGSMEGETELSRKLSNTSVPSCYVLLKLIVQ